MKNNYKKLFNVSRDLRNNQTKAEEIFWDIVRNKQVNNLKFLRQKIIGEFVVDFYCDELKLIIEIDGKIHDNLKEKDKERENILKNLNYKILRFENDFILNNTKEKIKYTLFSSLTG